MIKILVISVFITLFASLSDSGPTIRSKEKSDQSENSYNNPVVAYSLPDPTVIKAADGYFYLYATENIRNTPIHRSSDLVNWKRFDTPIVRTKGWVMGT